MNKRVREKVAARKSRDRAAQAAKDEARTLSEAVKEAQVSATNLRRAVIASVQQSAGEAFQYLKDKLVAQEEHAEQLLQRVPGVGPSAAKKLHEMTHTSVSHS